MDIVTPAPSAACIVHRRTKWFPHRLHPSRTLRLEDVKWDPYLLLRFPATLPATPCGLSYAVLPLLDLTMMVRSMPCVLLIFNMELKQFRLHDPM